VHVLAGCILHSQQQDQHSAPVAGVRSISAAYQAPIRLQDTFACVQNTEHVVIIGVYLLQCEASLCEATNSTNSPVGRVY
jgi:hypothetical protein